MQNKRTRELKLLIVMLLGLVLLSGCQLAREDGEVTNNDDRLIGVFITINEHPGSAIGLNYRERLYATPVVRERIEEAGTIHEETQYAFEGLSGVPFFLVEHTGDYGSSIGFTSDEAITERHMAIDSSDGAEKITIEGTIYVALQGEEAVTQLPETGNSRLPTPQKIFYINPVYKDASGKIYTVDGQGIASNHTAEGSSFSKTLEETTTIRENNQSKTSGFAVKVSITTILPPEHIVVLYMDKDSRPLARKEYSPGKLPTALAPEAGTEFIIVESHKRSIEGKSVITRELYDRQNETISTFYAREDGLCCKQITELHWPSGY
ncbi:MAG: hypothetical protein GX060_09615 [Firmicutes bacterium]|nr:hypothetical protein [Bacillota bacterium]